MSARHVTIEAPHPDPYTISCSVKVSPGALVRALSRNEELLQGYLAGRRLARRTRACYGVSVRSFTRLVPVPLEEAGRPELEAWYRRAATRGMAASTIVLYTVHLRKLLEYALMGRGLSRAEARVRVETALEGIPLVDLHREVSRMLPGRDSLVTPEELDALLRVASHPRTRALVAVLDESACRKGELLGLRIRDVTRYAGHMTRYAAHVVIRVLGKTGERTLPLVRSVPYLEAWLEAHPDPRPSTPLFATVWRGEVRRMDERTPNRLLVDLCARAGVRHVHPHMLRHTRLTELAAAGIGEYQLKAFAGWTPDSKMAARYIHLSGRDVVPAILRIAGAAIAPRRGRLGRHPVLRQLTLGGRPR